MITSYKGRRINPFKTVKVYRNLHTKGYSIKQDNLVVAHATAVTLVTCEFVVSEKNRQRVLTTKQKNVHAFIKGYVDSDGYTRKNYTTRATYNPYKAGTFICLQGDDVYPLYRARIVKATPDGVFIFGPNA